MIIGEDYFESIIVTNSDDEPIAIITDEEIVEKDGYKVIIEPTK
jgi:hypothetical protein